MWTWIPVLNCFLGSSIVKLAPISEVTGPFGRYSKCESTSHHCIYCRL
jgi:hypothetical protein